MALILEDGTGKADANSYASVAEADAYFAVHLYPGGWTAADAATKESALIQATGRIESLTEWDGTIKTATQALSWPRYSTYDKTGRPILSTVIPTALKDAVAETAKWLLAADPDVATDTEGIESLKVDVISLKFRDTSASKATLPEVVTILLDPLSSSIAGAGIDTMDLVRA